MTGPQTPAEVRRSTLLAQGVPEDVADLLLDALDALAHYRTRVHVPEDPGYHRVATWVNDEAVALADSVMRRTDTWLRCWWRTW